MSLKFHGEISGPGFAMKISNCYRYSNTENGIWIIHLYAHIWSDVNMSIIKSLSIINAAGNSIDMTIRLYP